MTPAHPPSLAERVAAAWHAKPLPRQTVKRMARRFDPEVRIYQPHRFYRFRVYKFTDGSRLRTTGQGFHFRIVSHEPTVQP